LPRYVFGFFVMFKFTYLLLNTLSTGPNG